jgi:hypothetical protein
VTNNNGFWIGWLDLLTPSFTTSLNQNQLQQLTTSFSFSFSFSFSCLNSDFSESESESHVTTDGQPASLSWNKAPIWGLRPDLDYCLTVAGLLVLGALSDERTGLSFATAAGPRQRSHSLVRVPRDSQPYLSATDSRLPFSSPPTTCRATVEVFDPASTRDYLWFDSVLYHIYSLQVDP